MYLHPCQYEPMKAAAQQQQSPKRSGGWGWVAGHPHDSHPENRSLHPLWNQTKHLCLNLTRVTSTLCIWMRRGVGEHTNTEGKEGFHWLVKEWDEQTIERRPHMKLKCIQEIDKPCTVHFPSPNHLTVTVSCFHSYLSFSVFAHPYPSSSILLPMILFPIPAATPPLSPLPHGQTRWPRLPASFDVSDVTPALQMPLRRQSYPLREPAQPTERASH